MNPLSFVSDDIMKLTGASQKPNSKEARKDFFGEIGRAVGLVREEPEILMFAAAQWLVLGVGYYAWVQGLGWIPEEVWEEIGRALDEGTEEEAEAAAALPGLAILAWSFFVVGCVSLPLGFFNSCIGASHFLRRRGFRSTVGTCLRTTMRRLGSLWAFSFFDAWVTAERILDRLPKKSEKSGRRAKRIANEAVYYAWKLGTMGVVGGLLDGKSLVAAGRDSVIMVKDNMSKAAVLRGGYSAACWAVGIAAYAGAVLLYGVVSGFREDKLGIYEFYLLAGVPVFVAAGAVAMFLRPVYTILSVDMYCDRFSGTAGR